MDDSALFLMGFALATAGMACFALSIATYWKQVAGTRPYPLTLRVALRVLGAALLIGAFELCAAVDPASMAALVWTMLLTVAAAVVAATLTLHARFVGGGS